ncbi:MAG TPA: hypothetical protein V6C52_13335 [Coleofasciculaceae cyanobacterium]|jgi:hypothetical protein
MATQTLATDATSRIRNLDMAEKLYRVCGNWTRDARVGGLSVEDAASRFLNLFAISIPQGYVAIKKKATPWERNIQNFISFFLGIGMTIFFKNDKFGFNPLLNTFMKPQEKLPANPGLIKWLINRARLKTDYFDILKAAGIEVSEKDREKALWSSLDGNQRTLIDGLYNKLRKKEEKGILTEAEKAIKEALPAFRRRLIAFPALSLGLITLTTVYIMGFLTTWFVFKFVVPLDAKYKANEEKHTQSKSGQHPQGRLKPVTFSAPPIFQYFSQAFNAGNRFMANGTPLNLREGSRVSR